jgi:hypothetical protein
MRCNHFFHLKKFELRRINEMKQWMKKLSLSSEEIWAQKEKKMKQNG